jgi:non-specific serine/threonine protein kinase
MGVVYLARDPVLERQIALKILPVALARNEAWRGLFQQEARLLAALNHPNIATIYSLEEDEEWFLLTMEVVEGKNLKERLAAGHLSLLEALTVGRQIASALEAAHKQGVVHRDLKPLNVMVKTDLVVKVLDFGVAVRIAEGAPLLAGLPDPAAKGSPSGTPGYMSPEQIRAEPADLRSDIWAFGCILYECLAGVPLVSGATPFESFHATLHSTVDLERLPAATPESIRGLIEGCLAKEISSRWNSIAAARRIIEEEIAQQAILRTIPSAPASRAVHPNNLPVQLSSFIGREAEIEAVGNLLAAHHAVTLTGIGGGGKTRLSLRVAESLLSEFSDGVWFVELASLHDGSNVAHALADGLGVKEIAGEPILETIARDLAGKKCLLLLDNCEHLLAACAELASAVLKAAPQVRILASSRERLGFYGEVAFAVPPLRLPDAGAEVDRARESEAVRLFAQRVRQTRHDFEITEANAAAVIEVCRQLDGIPLAIELAARRAGVLPVEEIRRRLGDRFRILSQGTRGSLPHHQTLRLLIDWSHEQLEPAERALLRRLSVFAGGWTLEAAEIVGASDAAEAAERIEGWGVLDLLTRLVDKSLVEFDAGNNPAGSGRARFRMLETVRIYAREKLALSGEEAEVARRHRDCFLGLAEQAEPELTGSAQIEWRARLAADHENLRLALDECCQEGCDPAFGLRLAGSLFRYWHVSGHWREAHVHSARVLARAGEARTAEAAKVQNSAAAMAFRFGDLEEAETGFRRTLAIWEGIGHDRGVAAARMNLANIALSRGDNESARRQYEDSLARFRAIGDQMGSGQVLVNLGNVSLAERKYEEALASFQEALELERAVGNMEMVGHALNSLGIAALRLDRLEEARGYYEESLAFQNTIGDRWNIGIAHENLAVVSLQQKRYGEALAEFKEGLRVFRSLGDRSSIAATLEGIAVLCSTQSMATRTVRLLAVVSSLRETLTIPRVQEEEEAAQASLATARETLDPDTYAELWAEGRKLDLEDAVREALAVEIAAE